MKRIEFVKLKPEGKAQEYQTLKHELKLVAEIAPFGAHKEVADKVGISEKYSKQIRSYEGAKHPTYDNYELVKRMVINYRRINSDYAKKLTA